MKRFSNGTQHSSGKGRKRSIKQFTNRQGLIVLGTIALIITVFFVGGNSDEY